MSTENTEYQDFFNQLFSAPKKEIVIGTTMSLEEFSDIPLTLLHGTSTVWENPMVQEKVTSEKALPIIKRLVDFYGTPFSNHLEEIAIENYHSIYQYYTESYVSGGYFLTDTIHRAISYANNKFGELHSTLMNFTELMSIEDKKACLLPEDLEYLSFLEEHKNQGEPVVHVVKDVRVGDLLEEYSKEKLEPNMIYQLLDSFQQMSYQFMGDVSTLSHEVRAIDDETLLDLCTRQKEALIEKYREQLIFEKD